MFVASIAYGIAVAAGILVLAATIRLYPRMPPRFPLSEMPNYQPTFWGPRWIVFAGPVLLLAQLLALPWLFAYAPSHGPAPGPWFFTFLWLVYAEAAAIVWWGIKRNVAIAEGRRGPVHYREILPWTAVILATVACMMLGTRS